MYVNATSSSNIDLTASYGTKLQRERQEAQQAGRDVTPDNDSDDQAAKTTPSSVQAIKSAQPSVSSSGQTVGTIINTKA
jgi:hypothetical protein